MVWKRLSVDGRCGKMEVNRRRCGKGACKAEGSTEEEGRCGNKGMDGTGCGRWHGRNSAWMRALMEYCPVGVIARGVRRGGQQPEMKSLRLQSALLPGFCDGVYGDVQQFHLPEEFGQVGVHEFSSPGIQDKVAGVVADVKAHAAFSIDYSVSGQEVVCADDRVGIHFQ